MSKAISSFILFVSICQLSVGIWEAVCAASNAPSNINLDAPDQEIYGFTVAKACCNILSGVSLFITGAIMCCIDQSSDKTSSSKDSFFQTVCFGTSVWGLVRYFDTGFYDGLIRPYQQVLLVEMIYFFSVIGIVVLAICFGCCFTCCAMKSSDNGPNQPVSLNSIDITNIKIPDRVNLSV
jgi:hypothetical protein